MVEAHEMIWQTRIDRAVPVVGDALRFLRKNLDITQQDIVEMSKGKLQIIDVSNVEEGRLSASDERIRTYMKVLGFNDADAVIKEAAELLYSYGATIPLGLGQTSAPQTGKADYRYLLTLPSMGDIVSQLCEGKKKGSFARALGLSRMGLYNHLDEKNLKISKPLDESYLRHLAEYLGMERSNQNPQAFLISQYLEKQHSPDPQIA